MNICLVADCMSMAAASNNVCDACWDKRVNLLRQIPQLWFSLHNLLEPGARGMQDVVTSSPVRSRPPLQVCVLDVLHAVPNAMAYWANGCLAEAGLPMLEARGRRWGALLSASVAVLESRDHTMRLHYQARLYLDELVTLTRRMATLATLDPAVARIKGPCPRCGNTRIPLLRDTHSQRVICPGCRTGWDRDGFVDVVMEKARKG